MGRNSRTTASPVASAAAEIEQDHKDFENAQASGDMNAAGDAKEAAIASIEAAVDDGNGDALASKLREDGDTESAEIVEAVQDNGAGNADEDDDAELSEALAEMLGESE